jgi:hypothetical protein
MMGLWKGSCSMGDNGWLTFRHGFFSEICLVYFWSFLGKSDYLTKQLLLTKKV